jgi:alginate production protein
VSCKVGEGNRWQARKIKISDIKGSDKLKGNITKVSVDGESPDTIEVEGLKIILNKKTDINEFGAFNREIEDEIFPDLKFSGYSGGSEGHMLGEHVLLTAEYRQTSRSRIEHDLYEAYETDNSEARPELRIALNGKPHNNIDAFFQLRLRKWLSINDDRINPPANDLDFEISQLYLVLKNFGTSGLTFQLGRQDFDENREWLFDDYLDAARVYYYGWENLLLESALIHGVSPLKDKFDTWTDLFIQARWYFNINNRIRAYALRRWDSEELRNREPVWYGIGYHGEFNNVIFPWAEYSIMRGEDKGRSLEANAYDFGFTGILYSNRFKPSISLSRAMGSGDEVSGDDISNEFRQTGYQDNVDYLGGINNILYYGELLDPEISNIKINTACFGFLPLKDFSVQVAYHIYKQDEPDDRLRGDLYDPPARPNGSSDDIGQETDVILGVTNIWNRLSLSWIFAIFEPGDAYIQPYRKATLNKLNLKFDI